MAQLSDHPECVVLHVYFNDSRVTYEEYDQVLRGEEQAAYRQFIAPINCQGIHIRPVFEEGANVSPAIHRVVNREKADLVVMATRGRSGSAAILLGSVTEAAIVESHVPLLVVKHFGAQLGMLQVLLDRKFRRQGDVQTD